MVKHDVEQRLKEIAERAEKSIRLRKSAYGERCAVVYDGDIHPDDQNDKDSRQDLEADTLFIAASRADIPWLLKLIQHHRKYLQEIARPAIGGKLQQYAAREALEYDPDKETNDQP